MPRFKLPLFANVTEAGDVVLFFMFFGATLVVGLTLLGIYAVVGRLLLRRAPRPPISTQPPEPS